MMISHQNLLVRAIFKFRIYFIYNKIYENAIFILFILFELIKKLTHNRLRVNFLFIYLY
jgi:hypothetical protein